MLYRAADIDDIIGYHDVSKIGYGTDANYNGALEAAVKEVIELIKENKKKQ